MLDDARRQIRVFASAHEAGEFIQKHSSDKDHPGRHVANAASTGTKRYGHYWAYEGQRRLTLEDARNSVTIQSWAPAIEYKQRHGDAIKGKTEFGRRRRVDEELRTSVRMFRPKHPATAVDILRRLFGDLREHALLILNGRIYATRYFLGLERQFLGYEKNQGHVALLASALRHGAKFPNVAMAPDSFDIKCSKYEAMVHNFSACVSPKRDAELRAARSTTVVQQDLILDNSWFEPEDYARYAHVLNLPGQTTGSYSRNLNHLWATGAVVHMWDSDIVEWYYPGLIPGESMVVVDRDTAQATVRKLNENPELMTALAAGGLRIDRELVCPHCIADYLRRAFTMIRDETGLGEVVDDLGLVLKLAAENGTACDAFVEVVIRDRKTGADAVTSKPAVEAGDSLCEVLKRGG